MGSAPPWFGLEGVDGEDFFEFCQFFELGGVDRSEDDLESLVLVFDLEAEFLELVEDVLVEA